LRFDQTSRERIGGGNHGITWISPHPKTVQSLKNGGRSRANQWSREAERKGLLTPDNCVVAFIDHQPQMLFGVSYPDRESIINHTVALAKASRVFDVPVVLST